MVPGVISRADIFKRMRMLVWGMLVVAGFFMGQAGFASAATVQATIDLSRQDMAVSVYGKTKYRWAVSTGRSGYRTPTGTYRPKRLEREWYSTKYDNAPMPYSIFFRGGYAIHGTTAIRSLGRPASHGCVRLHPDNARALYNLVRKYGMSATRITIKP